tara:strand:- start:401 stop:643 length:243 start_codon:yes stop_codon:yes gene_type:complete
MKKDIIVLWPNGKKTEVSDGSNWLEEAAKVGIKIPTGCLGGSCGACEIEVNGEVVRSCISTIKREGTRLLKVEFYSDPYW